MFIEFVLTSSGAVTSTDSTHENVQERERGRERKRKREGETERERNRKRERQRERRETGREREREKERERVCVCVRERESFCDRYTSGGAVTSTDAAHEQRQVTRTSLSHLGPELSKPREVGIIGTNECNPTQHTYGGGHRAARADDRLDSSCCFEILMTYASSRVMLKCTIYLFQS